MADKTAHRAYPGTLAGVLIALLCTVLSFSQAEAQSAANIPQPKCDSQNQMACDMVVDSIIAALKKNLSEKTISASFLESTAIKIEIKKQFSSNNKEDYYMLIRIHTQNGECSTKKIYNLAGELENYEKFDTKMVDIMKALYQEAEQSKLCVMRMDKIDEDVRFMYINNDADQRSIPVGTSHNLSHTLKKYAPIVLSMKNLTPDRVKVKINVEITGCAGGKDGDTNCADPVADTVDLEPFIPRYIPVYPKFLGAAFRETPIQANARVLIEELDENGQPGVTHTNETYKLELLPYNQFVWRQNVVSAESGETELLPVEEAVKLLVSWIDFESPEIETFFNEQCENCRGYYASIQGLDTIESGVPEEKKRQFFENQVGAFYNSLKTNYSAKYNSQTITYDKFSQKIRLPREVFFDKPSVKSREAQANCIDWTLLYSSLLLKSEMNPIIIIIPGHAMVGWRAWRDSKSIRVLETTQIKDKGFEEAMTLGEQKMATCTVDGDSLMKIISAPGFLKDRSVEVISSHGQSSCGTIFSKGSTVAIFVDIIKVMHDDNFTPMDIPLNLPNSSGF